MYKYKMQPLSPPAAIRMKRRAGYTTYYEVYVKKWWGWKLVTRDFQSTNEGEKALNEFLEHWYGKEWILITKKTHPQEFI